MPPNLLGAKLVDGNPADADVFTRSFADGHAREKIRGLGVMTVALVAVLFVEVGEDKKILFVPGERLEREGKFIISAFLLREPILFPNAVRKIETRHAHWCLDALRDRAGGHRFR